MFLLKKKESGRSMVEMIGVISVIGILSVIAVKTVQHLNSQFKLSRLEDAMHKAILLVDAKQIRTKDSLTKFFNKAVKEFNIQVDNSTCTSPDNQRHQRPFCYRLIITNINDKILSAFEESELEIFKINKNSTPAKVDIYTKKGLIGDQNGTEE